MAAINENIVCKERHKLEDVIPLDTPYTLAIDPSNVCNFKCNFCAIQYKKEELPFRKQFMDIELFKKIIDDLTQFPERLKVLRINGQGEPLLNPNLPDMIRYAKEKKVADFVEIITNGSKLCPSLNQKLIDSGIDRIRISIEALDSEGYKDICGANIEFSELLSNIKDLHERSGKCEIYCKIVDVAVPTEADKNRFIELFGEICDRFFIDNVIPLWSDFDELKINSSVTGVHGQVVRNVNVCPFPFYSLIINPDGEVTVCCADWKRKLIVGDLKTESMKEIWNGKKLRDFWIAMLEGKKNCFEMCRKCLLPMYDCNDFIDNYAENIKKKIERESANE